MKKETAPLPFDSVLKTLANASEPFTKRMAQYFSDIAEQDLSALMKVWPTLPAPRRQAVMQTLTQIMDEDMLVSFTRLAESVLGDEDAEVRAMAVRMLWEAQEPRTIPALIALLQTDVDHNVRAEAASVLGIFVYLGEMEEIPADAQEQVEAALLQAYEKDESLAVQRKTIEALGYSSRAEIPALLEEAFRHADPLWQASALFAMGRSGDARWEEKVMAGFVHERTDVRLAAVEASGELSLVNARPVLLRMLETEEEAEVFQAVIWALSQIGGEDVQITLEALLDTLDEDSEEAEFIQDALDNLLYTEDISRLDLLAFDPDDPPETE